MSIASTSALADVLRQCRLLEPAQLEELRALQARCPEPQRLVHALIERGWLTEFQGERLLEGRGPELVLGSYVLLEPVGEGGMGQVFKARHRNLDRVVALKLIRPERLGNPDAVRRFQREVRAAAALAHPNIVHAYDADQTGSVHYLVMEYIAGAVDLHGLVKQAGPLPVARACDLVRQAALGLQHAYEQGLVHRDIKPQNLLLTRDGTQLKVLDMGLARMHDPTTDPGNSGATTMEGAIIGTPDYIAPEQALESHLVDIRADIYSLGCTFYFLLTAQVPFPGGTFTAKLLRHQTDTPTPVRELRPDLPPGVAAMVERMMAKKPDGRYSTPAEVAEALATVPLLGNMPAPLANTTVAPGHPPLAAETPSSLFSLAGGGDTAEALAAPYRPLRRARRPLWIGAAVAAASLVALGLAGLLLPSHEPEPAEPAASKPRAKDKRAEAAPIEGEDPLATASALLGGTWHYLGPFDNPDMQAFDIAYPPERGVDLMAAYLGKNGKPIRWQTLPQFGLGRVVDLKALFDAPEDQTQACVYLYHEIDVAEATPLPVALGSDDTLTVWLNGECLVARKVNRAALPDDDFALLRLQPGKNRLLVKVCQGLGLWGFYLCPRKPWLSEQPGFAAWLASVAPLPALQQVEAVRAKLVECNPHFDGTVTPEIDKDIVVGLAFPSDDVTDVSPVRALPGLRRLDCAGKPSAPWVARGRLADLAPLRGMALTELICARARIGDLAPLAGMPLARLNCASNAMITDLAPLRGMPLTELDCSWTRVADLAPVAAMPLTSLHCTHTFVTDLAPLRALPVKELVCDFFPGRDAALLRSLPSLEKINGRAVPGFWKSVAKQQAALEAWCGEVAALPAAEQVEAVAERLRKLNPPFKGKVGRHIENGVVKGLQFVSDQVADLSPLQALAGLEWLDCSGGNYRSGRVCDLTPLAGQRLQRLICHDTQVADLAPLRDMPLQELNISGTRVADLAPLRGVALSKLDVRRTRVVDLSPLQAMPLREIDLDVRPDLDRALLRTLPALQKINARPAAEFIR